MIIKFLLRDLKKFYGICIYIKIIHKYIYSNAVIFLFLTDFYKYLSSYACVYFCVSCDHVWLCVIWPCVWFVHVCVCALHIYMYVHMICVKFVCVYISIYKRLSDCPSI